ncbi:hypothetical protein TraAM80_04153 [Trypanosoma rangeli]|uniref:Uncharacterized protein n=1 Tax=Trypanosoma rangeli TaxID=5698 RepID=A0A3R7RL08_TRYRA|nr:uncharacterized protein TraAM80_04153 [Trypanosoma rangeli]RNF06276.1 hypothetical protein TraAM80_04153 [Trypanosoma rangeli]|eukprot:RNF06276.1 hypothetical protein TraAM80_04153 [Trypanosoma rangeli]
MGSGISVFSTKGIASKSNAPQMNVSQADRNWEVFIGALNEWKKRHRTSPGTLECMASGYTSLAEYQRIGVTFKQLVDRLNARRTYSQQMWTSDMNSVQLLLDTSPLQVTLDVVKENMPFLFYSSKSVPFNVMLEIILSSAAGLSCGALSTYTSLKMLDEMCYEIDKSLSTTLKSTVACLKECLDLFPVDIVSAKNDYYNCSEPILAPFISCLAATSRKFNFFVSLEERVKMLSDVKSFSSPEELINAIRCISSLISELLACFTFRVLLHIARFIHAVPGLRKTDEERDNGANKKSSLNGVGLDLRGLAEHVISVCKGFEKLPGDGFTNCRRHYPHVFAFSDYFLQWTESEGRPPTITVVVNALLKQMFLFAGGLRSIAADEKVFRLKSLQGDNALNKHSLRLKQPNMPAMSTSAYRSNDALLTEDILLTSALRVDVVSWATVIVKLLRLPSDVRGPTDTVTNAVMGANILRTLYQYMGLLPFGAFCPRNILRWIDIFPLYTLNEEAIRTILFLYSRVAEQETRIMRPIDRSDALRSVMRAVKGIERAVVRNATTKVVADIIVPEFDSETPLSSDNDFQRSRCGMMYESLTENCISKMRPPVDITDCAKLTFIPQLLAHVSPYILSKVADVLSAAQIMELASRAGALVRWSSAANLKDPQKGDVLYVEALVEAGQGDGKRKNIARQNATNEPSLPQSAFGDPISRSMRDSFTSTLHKNRSSKNLVKNTSGKVTYRWAIIWSLQVRDDEHVIIFGGNVEIPSGFSPISINLVGHCVPLFIRPGSEEVFWTNPDFEYNLDNVRLHLLPFTIGWLLGNGVANEVPFGIRIAPLAFHFIAFVLNFNASLKELPEEMGNLTLVYEDLFTQFKEINKTRMGRMFDDFSDDGTSAETHDSPSPTDLVANIIMNLDKDKANSLRFWDEVARGFKFTALGHSPLLKNCCSRVVQNVLCGLSSVDETYKGGFGWENYFVFLPLPQLADLPYGDHVARIMRKCLKDDFVGEEVRRLLMFFTGQSRLPASPLTNCIFLIFEPASVLPADGGHKSDVTDNSSLQMLPMLWQGHHVLELPSSLEAVLVGSRVTDTSPEAYAAAWLGRSPEKQSSALETFKSILKEKLHATARDVDMQSGRGGGGRRHPQQRRTDSKSMGSSIAVPKNEKQEPEGSASGGPSRRTTSASLVNVTSNGNATDTPKNSRDIARLGTAPPVSIQKEVVVTSTRNDMNDADDMDKTPVIVSKVPPSLFLGLTKTSGSPPSNATV